MRAVLGAVVVAGLLAAAPVCAQDPPTAPAQIEQKAEQKSCDVEADLLNPGDTSLDKVTAAVKERKALEVMVVGSGSSSIASADGASLAYPARFESYLRERLPGVAVTVTTSLQPKRPAEEIADMLQGLVAERKADLVVWQTGTVDAIKAIHPDDFRNAVDEGITAVKAAGADAVLMNLQFSPRMETMLPTTPYLDNIRAVAQQQDGKITVLASLGASRFPLLKDVPTIGESFPGYVADSWAGLFVPVGTPTPIIDRLRMIAHSAINLPEIRERLATLGITVADDPSPEAFGKMMREERAKWTGLLKEIGPISAN